MDSIIEKITLYDLLAYMLSGSVLLLMILGGSYPLLPKGFLSAYAEYTGAFYLAFAVGSYVAGLALSEISGPVFAIIRKAGMRIGGKGRKEEAFYGSGLDGKQMAKALIKAGLADKTLESADADLLKRYMPYMYGIVQASEEHKRIHNYSSAYTLYKNLSLAFALGMAVWYRLGILDGRAAAIGTLLAAALGSRAIRFGRKKNQYTLIWFADKFR